VKGDFDIPLSSSSSSSNNHNSSTQNINNHGATGGSSNAGLGAGAGGAGETYPIPTALSKVVTHGGLRIGFTNGFTIIPPGDPDSLLIAARQMDVDVLCWGGTSRFEAYEMEGKFFVNPGSATGACSWHGGGGSSSTAGGGEGQNGSSGGDEDGVDEDGEVLGATPSFVLMDVQGDVLVLYVYQLRRDDEGKESVAVEKVSFRKGGSG